MTNDHGWVSKGEQAARPPSPYLQPAGGNDTTIVTPSVPAGTSTEDDDDTPVDEFHAASKEWLANMNRPKEQA